MRTINEIIIHCTATDPTWRKGQTPAQRVEGIREMHVQGNGWRDIGYHWLIDRDGTVSPGRPETATGAHVRGRNKNSIGVSLFGGRTSTATDDFRQNYTQEQEWALIKLLQELLKKYPGAKISGHNQYAAKACPGFNAPQWWANAQSKPEPVLTPPAPEPAPLISEPPTITPEVEELIAESESGGLNSKTNIFSVLLGLAGVGGPLASVMDAMPAEYILIGLGVIATGVALYVIHSRGRKTRRGKDARASMMPDFGDMEALLSNPNVQRALMQMIKR